MICGSRDVVVKYHMGNHELTPIIYSLMRYKGTPLDGWEGKLQLAACVLGKANVTIFKDIPYKSECIAIDTMYLMNHISIKPSWIKTGIDLAAEFCKHVESNCKEQKQLLLVSDGF